MNWGCALWMSVQTMLSRLANIKCTISDRASTEMSFDDLLFISLKFSQQQLKAGVTIFLTWQLLLWNPHGRAEALWLLKSLIKSQKLPLSVQYRTYVLKQIALDSLELHACKDLRNKEIKVQTLFIISLFLKQKGYFDPLQWGACFLPLFLLISLSFWQGVIFTS